MKKYDENMKNYEEITLLIYRQWDLEKFRGVGVPGPRERLGFFTSPRTFFSKGYFPNVTSSRGGGRREQRHEICQIPSFPLGPGMRTEGVGREGGNLRIPDSPLGKNFRWEALVKT